MSHQDQPLQSSLGERLLKAVALGYRRGVDPAPRVLAKGRGEIAKKIIQIARANNIPIQEDPCLVGLLAELDLNQEIPPVLYRAVAEVLAFVYRVREKNAYPGEGNAG
ncbi:MAG: EscU/YscU/HrcU family type III secretion system export apparatus switch protein [bacterium]